MRIAAARGYVAFGLAWGACVACASCAAVAGLSDYADCIRDCGEVQGDDGAKSGSDEEGAAGATDGPRGARDVGQATGDDAPGADDAPVEIGDARPTPDDASEGGASDAGDAGDTGEASDAMTAVDAPAGVTCSAATDCPGATPYCCARLALAPDARNDLPPRCTQTSLTSVCAATCADGPPSDPTTCRYPATGAAGTVRLCARDLDCLTDLAIGIGGGCYAFNGSPVAWCASQTAGLLGMHKP